MTEVRIAPRALLVAALLTVSSAVQASTIIDLTVGGSHDAPFVWTDAEAIGSDVIDAFLRVQNRSSEQRDSHGVGHNNVPWDSTGDAHDNLAENLVGDLIALDHILFYTSNSPITSPDGSLSHRYIHLHALLDDSEPGFSEWGKLQKELARLKNDVKDEPAAGNASQAPVIPEPGTMLLLGTGLLFAARQLRKTS